jgi:hypothetical protein
LPGGFELRGGRFLNRFGFQNAVHNHGWDFVNQNLLNGRLLQEGELTTEGGEVTWNLPFRFASALSVSYGVAPGHDGDHGHEHGGEEAEFEGEGARFEDDFVSANYAARYDWNDFHQHRAILSGAWGDNEFGRSTQIYGAGYEYLWRENGYSPGGRYFRWRSEVAYRRFGAVAGELHGEEHGHGEEGEHEHEEEHEGEHEEEHEDGGHGRRATLDEAGVYTAVAYGFGDRAEAGLRLGWVEGIGEAGLDERFRVSPALTLSLNRQRTVLLRMQYDYDHFRDGSGAEHSGWVQLGFNWGGPEVR